MIKINNNFNTREQFKTIVEKAFDWTVEADPNNTHESEHKLRKNFYDDVYVPRENEEAIFERFINGEKNILVITGHVGIGKSTFLRHQLEHKKSCTGIVIDFNRWAEKFSNADFGHALRATISRCFRNRLTENVAYCLLHKLDITEDVTYACSIIDSPFDVSDNVIWEKAQVHLAALILENSRHITDSTIESLRQEYGEGVSLDSSEIRVEQYKNNILRNHKVACGKIFQATRYYEWIRLYQIMFKPEQPVLVAFDNSDNLNLSSIKECLFEELCKIHGEINIIEDATLITGTFSSNIRLSISIRDENASLLRVTGQPASRTMQLALGMEDYMIPSVAENRELPTTKSFVAEIIKRRYLSITKSKDIDTECFKLFTTLINFWYTPDIETGVLEESVARISIIDLGNYSIRWVLDDIKFTCLHTLDACLFEGISSEHISQPGTKPWLRGRIIRSLWGRPSMQTFTRILQKDFRRKCTEPYLSRARMILTYLSSISEWGKEIVTTVSGIYESLQYYFPTVTIDETKEVLCALYVSNIRQGELIVIRQHSLIQKPEDICHDAEVAIMPRGAEMLNRVLTNLDYFGSVLPSSANVATRNGVRKIFAGMIPTEAAQYVETILDNLILKMAKHYEKCWKEFIIPRIDADERVPNGTKYFEKFRRDLFILPKSTFYIIRICDSHIDAIRNYIVHSLSGDKCALFLNLDNLNKLATEKASIKQSWDVSKVQQFEKVLTRGLQERPDDSTITNMLNNLKDDNPLFRLWAVAVKLREIQKNFKQISLLKKGENKS